MMDLPGHREAIVVIQFAQVGNELVGRREVGQVDVDLQVLDAPARYVHHPSGGELIGESPLELDLYHIGVPVQPHERVPLGLLARADEGEERSGVQAQDPVVCRGVVLVPSVRQQVRLDVLLERRLQMCLHHCSTPVLARPGHHFPPHRIGAAPHRATPSRDDLITLVANTLKATR